MDSHYNKQNKLKKTYHSKLLYSAPAIYEAYKKMQQSKKINLSNQNTSQTSLEVMSYPLENNISKNNYININNTISRTKKHNNISRNVSNIYKPHLSYTNFIKTKGFPFNREKRFKWQNPNENNYPTGVNIFPKVSRHIIVKNYFQNGINGFYNLKNEKFDLERKCRKKHIYLPSNDISFNRTRRVLNTEIESESTDYFERKHKKPSSLDKYNKFVNVGGIAELLKKTPIDFKYRGIKIVKRSNSCDLNLFRNDYGRFEKPKVRKHFIQKDNIVLGLKRNKSMDYYKNNIYLIKNNEYIKPSIKRNNNFYGKRRIKRNNSCVNKYIN